MAGAFLFPGEFATQTDDARIVALPLSRALLLR